jgi:acetyl esterase/lipase
MAPIVAKQPFKSIYIILLSLKALACIPWHLVRYGPKSARPYPQWSLAACVVTSLVRDVFRFRTTTRTSGLSSVESSHVKATGRFHKPKPGPDEVYRGPLLPGAAKPVPVGGLWYPNPPPETLDDDRIVLHFTGGAFVLALGSDENGQLIADAMSQHLQASRTFVAQYRVADGPDTRFPAALQDVVTFYNYILGTGIKPSNVIISGDSAGGNLVIAFLRYLETYPVQPKPGGAMVWSPWVKVTKSAGEDFEKSKAARQDLLYGPLLQWGADSYYPEDTPTADSISYISPLHHPFKITVPVWIHSGLAESFYDDIKEFASELSAVEGNSVRFCSTAGAPHALILSQKPYGFGEQLKVAILEAYAFFSGEI